MATIRHIAIFTDDPIKLAAFYGDVFGTSVIGVNNVGSAWVTDGYMNIALLRRRGEKAPRAGIHHWGFTAEAAQRSMILAKMKKYGIEPYSPYVEAPDAERPYAEDAVKDPDGNRFDLSTGMKALPSTAAPIEVANELGPKIRHIALFSDNTTRLAEFFCDAFGLTVTGESKGSIWITDGYLDFALLSRKRATAPRGIHHWGFTFAAADKPAIYKKLIAFGLPPFDPRAEDPSLDRPYVEEKCHDIDGNRFDLTTAKRDMEVEKERTAERLKKLVTAE